MLVFVTGVAGSGKSSLCAELTARGFVAHDADEGISRHFDPAAGVAVATPPRAAQTPEWATRHEFRFDLDRVKALVARTSAGEPAFLLGAAYGDDEVIALAERSWYLHLEEAELRRRIASRPGDGYGQAPHELESVLAWHAAASERYEKLGARRLDGDRPVALVADELLADLNLRGTT